MKIIRQYFFLIANIAFEQNTELDSLLKLLPKARPDTNLVKLYLNIGNQTLQ
jgi:hypothetical protein